MTGVISDRSSGPLLGINHQEFIDLSDISRVSQSGTFGCMYCGGMKVVGSVSPDANPGFFCGNHSHDGRD